MKAFSSAKVLFFGCRSKSNASQMSTGTTDARPMSTSTDANKQRAVTDKKMSSENSEKVRAWLAPLTPKQFVCIGTTRTKTIGMQKIKQ